MFSVVSLLLDANSWKFKKPFRLEFPPMFSCQKLSQFFPIVFFRKSCTFPIWTKKLPGRKFRKISNFQWLQPNYGGWKISMAHFWWVLTCKGKKKHKTPRRCCFDPAWGFSVFLLAALVGEKEFTMERKKEVHEKITSTALGYKKRLLVKSNMNMTFWIEMIFKNHGILRIG